MSCPTPQVSDSVPPFVSSLQTLGLLASEAEGTGHHFEAISLRWQTTLDLVSLLVGCQEGQLPRGVFSGGSRSSKAMQYLWLHI